MPAQAIHVAIWTMRECSPQGAHGVQCAESGAADRRVEWNSELWGWSCWDGTESHARNPGTAKGQPMGDALSGIWRIPPLACRGLQVAARVALLLPTAAANRCQRPASPPQPSPAPAAHSPRQGTPARQKNPTQGLPTTDTSTTTTTAHHVAQLLPSRPVSTTSSRQPPMPQPATRFYCSPATI